MSSLHRANGKKQQTKFVEPSPREGFALAMAAIMQWSKLRDCANPSFFIDIAAAAKNLESTERNWREEDTKFFVTQRVFGGIPQGSVEQWIQREFMGLKGAEALCSKRAEVIANFLYKYLTTVDAGVDYESAYELAVKANIGEILQYKALGGQPSWTLDRFLSRDPWDDLGGKAGLKVQAKRLLTLVAAGGTKYKGEPAPIDPVCNICGELKFMHRGDRCKIDPIPCKCDGQSQQSGQPETVAKPKQGVKRTRGFDQVCTLTAHAPPLRRRRPRAAHACPDCACAAGPRPKVRGHLPDIPAQAAADRAPLRRDGTQGYPEAAAGRRHPTRRRGGGVVELDCFAGHWRT